MDENPQPASGPTPEASSSPAPTPPRPSLAERRARIHSSKRKSKVGSAAKWVLVIGILQVVVGVFLGIKGSPDADQALQVLAQYESDDLLELEDGTKRTAGELRADVERERIAGFSIPIGIGVAMLALYVWARRSPLPALLSALCLYILVHAVSGVLAPETLLQGVVIKVFFIAALVAGIKAALAEREAAAPLAA